MLAIARNSTKRLSYRMMPSISWQSGIDRSNGTKFAFFALGNALLLLSVFVFTTGFLSSELFPSEPFSQSDKNDNSQKQKAADAPFDRVVFLLVDALRPDFVYGRHSGFEFTQRHGSINNSFTQFSL
jgi:hypothetical protein